MRHSNSDEEIRRFERAADLVPLRSNPRPSSEELRKLFASFEKAGLVVLDYLGSGSKGMAVLLDDGRVLKVTSDPTEAAFSLWLLENPAPGVFPRVFEVWRDGDEYGIVREAVDDVPPDAVDRAAMARLEQEHAALKESIGLWIGDAYDVNVGVRDGRYLIRDFGSVKTFKGSIGAKMIAEMRGRLSEVEPIERRGTADEEALENPGRRSQGARWRSSPHFRNGDENLRELERLAWSEGTKTAKRRWLDAVRRVEGLEGVDRIAVAQWHDADLREIVDEMTVESGYCPLTGEEILFQVPLWRVTVRVSGAITGGSIVAIGRNKKLGQTWIQYADGRVAYDFPERVPLYLRRLIYRALAKRSEA